VGSTDTAVAVVGIVVGQVDNTAAVVSLLKDKTFMAENSSRSGSRF
jgi:hypothetical protein